VNLLWICCNTCASLCTNTGAGAVESLPSVKPSATRGKVEWGPRVYLRPPPARKGILLREPLAMSEERTPLCAGYQPTPRRAPFDSAARVASDPRHSAQDDKFFLGTRVRAGWREQSRSCVSHSFAKGVNESGTLAKFQVPSSRFSVGEGAATLGEK
jgi:hypothetical protein